MDRPRSSEDVSVCVLLKLLPALLLMTMFGAHLPTILPLLVITVWFPATIRGAIVEHFISIEGNRHVIRVGETLTRAAGDQECIKSYKGYLISLYRSSQLLELKAHIKTIRPTSPLWIRDKAFTDWENFDRTLSQVTHRKDPKKKCVAMVFDSSANTTVMKTKGCTDKFEIICTALEEPQFGPACDDIPLVDRVPCIASDTSVPRDDCRNIGCCYDDTDTPYCYHSTVTVPGYSRVPGYVYTTDTPIVASNTDLLLCARECAVAAKCTMFTFSSNVTELYLKNCYTYNDMPSVKLIDDRSAESFTYVKSHAVGWTCSPGQCEPAVGLDNSNMPGEVKDVDPATCFSECTDLCTTAEVSVSPLQQTCHLTSGECRRGTVVLDTLVTTATKVCHKGPILYSQTGWMPDLKVLTDGNPTTCINATTVDPLAQHLKLYFPWPSIAWDIDLAPDYVVKLKVTMELGLTCVLPTERWWAIQVDAPPEPEVFVYAWDGVEDPDSQKLFQGKFRRCAAYKGEVDAGNYVCYYRCVCRTSRCNSAYVFVNDNDLHVCELTEEP